MDLLTYLIFDALQHAPPCRLMLEKLNECFCCSNIIWISVHLVQISVADGGSLPAGRIRRIGLGNLEIRSIRRQDAGLYRCSLADAADVSAEAMLSVHGKTKTGFMSTYYFTYHKHSQLSQILFHRVSNTPGNHGNLQSLLEIFWFSLRVCAFVVNISYNSCISKCTDTLKYLAVNQDQLILRLVISVSVS